VSANLKLLEDTLLLSATSCSLWERKIQMSCSIIALHISSKKDGGFIIRKATLCFTNLHLEMKTRKKQETIPSYARQIV